MLVPRPFGFWHFPIKSGIAARMGGQPRRLPALPASFMRRRLSSAVEQRFCKPKVGGSIPSAGTSNFNTLPRFVAPFFRSVPA